MREGEPGETFVVVAAGELEVTVDGRPMGRLGPGTGFGEIALLRRSARTATVTALTNVTGFEIDSDTFACAVSGPTSAAITEQVAAASLQRGANLAAAEAGLPAGG